MKIKRPEPFTFESGPRAVLLLHGFTGYSADVRILGRFLEKHGYTSHAPIYRGHGTAPEELIETRPQDWWEDALAGYEHLKNLGYKEIAVAGLSLGGVLGLKMAYSLPIKAVIPMCSPMFFDNEKQLTAGFLHFSKQYKQLERKDDETIAREVDHLLSASRPMFNEIGQLIKKVQNEIDTIYTPAMVVQARQDKMINPESANYIYDKIESDVKKIQWYEQSGHVITLDKEKDLLHEDIFAFLESLDWA